MSVLVDSNVLIDIAFRDPVWLGWSSKTLARLMQADDLIINQMIFAEFSVRYESYEEADRLLPNEEFRREEIPWMAAFAAAKAFVSYRRAGGQKTRPLPDFFIGAHAAIGGHSVVTRDPAGYQTYFPDVQLITPDSHPVQERQA
jgi:predicted nucleic acid-binding protein